MYSARIYPNKKINHGFDMLSRPISDNCISEIIILFQKEICTFQSNN